MDFCAPPDLMDLADALHLMQAALTPVTQCETVPLSAALDRILAEALVAPIAVPGYDNSAMDGYALRAADGLAGAVLVQVGEALAGHGFGGILNPGECLRIMTGAPIPAGADAVIMQEQVKLTPQGVQLNHTISAGENIRRAGEDIAQGAEVLPTGRRLGPIEIGLLASLGIAQVAVRRRLKVALMSTGDELTPPGKPLAAGSIYDSNRYALIALLQRANVELLDLGLLADQPSAIEAAFRRAMNEADLVISTGGVSVGDADYTKQVLDKLGQIYFWKVAIKPGKPFAFGKLGAGWFFGLPGNPVSAVVTFHQLVLPSLRYLSGEAVAPTSLLSAVCAQAIKKQPGRMDFQRGILRNEDGVNRVYSTGLQSSGMLSSMAAANCYIVLERARGSVAAGETVQLLPFDRFLQ